MSLVLVHFSQESLFCINQTNIQRSVCLLLALMAVNVSVCVCVCVPHVAG